MKFVKCKTDAEKLNAIKEYCEEKIAENNFSIEAYKMKKESSLDYDSEIRDLQNTNTRFEVILNIIKADELTSVLLL